jgi:tripartite-type tricarboxylate transporter receptor subunit TctC
MAEAGLTGVDSSIWLGLMAPAGTPPDVIALLNKTVNEALKSEDLVRQMQLQGLEPLGGTSDEFARRIKDDTARWDAVLKASGLEK